ncbi:Cell shape-determining protein MreC [subsurface metagenome]|nr:rod shape-determining protein MreC [bacterium]
MPLFLKERKSLTILIALIFFHFLLISMQVPLGEKASIFEKTVFSVFSPVRHGILSFFRSIGNVWNNYFYFRNVQSQNEQMKEQIFYLRQENNLLRNALQKFRSEREIEENLLEMHESILPSRVIGLDPSHFYKSVIINRGTLDGIKKNMVVLDKNGDLVGRIVDAISLKEARVQLITDNESGISVFTEGNRIRGILVGDGEGQCLIRYVLATTTPEEISEGEDVITSGYDRIYPSGIRVGRIVSITTDTSLHKHIVVIPYFDFRYLDQIAVIMKDPQEFFKD